MRNGARSKPTHRLTHEPQRKCLFSVSLSLSLKPHHLVSCVQAPAHASGVALNSSLADGGIVVFVSSAHRDRVQSDV